MTTRDPTEKLDTPTATPDVPGDTNPPITVDADFLVAAIVVAVFTEIALVTIKNNI